MEGKREDELNCPVCRCKFALDKKGKNVTTGIFLLFKLLGKGELLIGRVYLNSCSIGGPNMPANAWFRLRV